MKLPTPDAVPASRARHAGRARRAALAAAVLLPALVRFNGEYHGTGSRPSNFMRTQLYLLSWFGKYPAAAAATAGAAANPAAPATSAR